MTGRGRGSPADPRPAAPAPRAIVPGGDASLAILFDGTAAAAVSEAVCDLSERIVAARVAGVRDVVPSFAAVGVHYDPMRVARAPHESPFAALRSSLLPLLDGASSRERPGRIVRIPVCYGGAFGPDLDETAAVCGLAAEELIAAHCNPEGLRVYMLGFAPGAPYLGMLDARLDVPRLARPRTAVPAGSVAIANRQSVIYPEAQPGGWRVIGRTPLVLFDAGLPAPCLLAPGDRVVFHAIDEETHEALARARHGRLVP